MVTIKVNTTLNMKIHVCSFTRYGSQWEMLKIESLLSVIYPWTISIPGYPSLAGLFGSLLA